MVDLIFLYQRSDAVVYKKKYTQLLQTMGERKIVIKYRDDCQATSFWLKTTYRMTDGRDHLRQSTLGEKTM